MAEQKRPLLAPEDVRRNCQAAVDTDYWQAIAEEQAYMLGIPSGSAFLDWHRHGGLVFVPDMRATYKEIGRVARTFQTANAAQSRMLSGDPAPEFRGLPARTEQVRKEWWRVRYENSGAAVEIALAHGSGDQHGLGVMEIGLRDDRQSGLQRMELRYSPTMQTLIDPLAWNKDRARFVAFVEFPALEDAMAAWPDYVTPDDAISVESASDRKMWAQKVVPTVRYYDIGIGDKAPTFALFVGGINKNPAMVKQNPYGAELPVAFMFGFQPTSLRFPVGRIAIQRLADEMINAVLKMMRDIAVEGRHLRLVNPKQVSAEQLNKWKQGLTSLVETNGPMDRNNPPVIDLPALDVPNVFLQLFQQADRDFGEQSQMTDIDRNGTTNSKMTAYQIAQQQAASNQNRGGLSKRTMAFFNVLMRKAVRIGAMYDRAPFDACIDELMVGMNRIDEAYSQMQHWLTPDVPTTVARQSLTDTDTDLQVQQNLSLIMQLLPLAQLGADPQELLKEAFRAANMDPERFLKAQPPMAQQPGMQGQQPGAMGPGQQQFAPMAGGEPTAGAQGVQL